MIKFLNKDSKPLDYIELSIFEKSDNVDFLLVQENQRLFLEFPKNKNFKPFSIDFTSNEILHRTKEIGKNNELIKAIGLKKDYIPNILDSTAGLGRDSFIIASKGCQVTMLERNTVVYYLLRNAIDLAKENSETFPTVNKMTLVNIDSIEYIKNTKIRPDIIYLDPMFPKSKKSRLVKKEMQIFHELVGNDSDSNLLLEESLKKTKNRVVVKRMLKDTYLNNMKPNFEIKGSTVRFDVYLKNQ